MVKGWTKRQIFLASLFELAVKLAYKIRQRFIEENPSMRGSLPPLAGRLAGLLPLMPMEMAIRHLINRGLAARPSFQTRLAEYAGRRFALDPVDCPFTFFITAAGGTAGVEILRDADAVPFDARIRAPLIVLMGMIDGTYDGDALFFSRDLSIEGDTEAVLALRNAMEDAEFTPGEVIGVPEKLRGPFNRAAEVTFAEVRRLLDAPEDNGPAAHHTAYRGARV